MNNYLKFYTGMTLLISLNACVMDQSDKQIVKHMEKMAAPYDTGTIFKAGFNDRPLFEERRVRNVGDALIMTIAAAPALVKKPKVEDEDAGESGKRKSRRERDEELSHIAKEVLVGDIAMIVMEVLDNGHLLVAGSKQVIVNEEDKNVRITGVVDPNNISGGNTVQSTLVFDVRIQVDDVRVYADRTGTSFSEGQYTFGSNFKSLRY